MGAGEGNGIGVIGIATGGDVVVERMRMEAEGGLRESERVEAGKDGSGQGVGEDRR